MKEAFYSKIKIPILFILVLSISVACQNDDLIYDVQSQDEQVKAPPMTFDNSGKAIPNRYIIVLNSSTQPEALPSELNGRGSLEQPEDLSGGNIKAIPQTGKYSFLSKYGLSVDNIEESYEGLFSGALLNTDAETAEALSKDPNIKMIEQDKIIALNVTPLIRTPFIPSNGDEGITRTPYGVNRVGGSIDFSKNSSWDKRWAWILDTGIDYHHPDLTVNTRFSRDFTYSRSSFDDVHGHGTHVAGIVGAKNNSLGTRGVAAGANLVAVKVLNDSGEGSTSSVVNGLIHIYRNALKTDVVNISLGGADSGIIGFGINLLGYLGTKIVVASGNSGTDCKHVSPANSSAPNVTAVGAIDWNDSFTSYSNYGSTVDFLAPGEGILSTYPGGKYAYMSGTSMAAPHVTGVMLLTSSQSRSSGKAWARNRYISIASHR